MNDFKTIKEPASDTIIVKKSEFIGYISPVKTEEDALEFVAKIKKKHADARHNVYAYIVRENNTTRFSDDGEPHGTAGVPVLELLRKEGLTDIAIVVTRYFGGILLGTGGLLRTYTATAKAALDKAEIIVYKNFTVFLITSSYADYPKINYLLQSIPVLRDNNDFGIDVKLYLAVPDKNFDVLKNNIADITCNRAVIDVIDNRYDFFKDIKTK